MSLKGKTKDISIVLPSLVRTEEFEPTALMIQVLCAYLDGIRKGKDVTPQELIVELGHNRTNWYNWQKRPLFSKWWSQSCQEFHRKTGLYNVHSAIYRRAVDNSPQDAKMYLDRFDPDYKPATAQDVNYAGVMPPADVADAVARSKVRAAQHSPEATQDSAGEENEPKPIPGQPDEYAELIEQHRGSIGQA